MLLSALIPQGYMPTATEDGYISVTMCTSEGLRTILLDERGAEVSPDPVERPEDRRGSAEHCLFATFAALALPDHDYSAQHVAALPADIARLSDFLLVLRNSSRPVGARAPPVSA